MEIRPEQIDPDAARVVQRLRRFNHAAYLVGGCVRDLLLGRKPKDFDVATSATPNEMRRMFRNCRIIGRRFRLAHVFFGKKIIETSTFRANPREVSEEDGAEANASGEAGPNSELNATDDTGAIGEAGPDSESGGSGETIANETSASSDNKANGDPKPANADLLIRHDNVFGTAEEDARRRDFTINGLFYDLETGQVIDHVNGLADLEARLVRTIGDPDIRFREDPVRILRAVKFAARCDLTIEPETYRRMMEHKAEITKCPHARVSEEFFRLLRAGAARRSFELLLGTGLLEVMVPELARALAQADSSEESKLRVARFWAYLAALDRSTQKREAAPTDALILAILLLPPLREVLHPDAPRAGDVGQAVAQAIQPFLERLRASRRESDLARQILLATRYVLPSSNPNRRRPNLEGREFFEDVMRLAEIVADAEGQDPTLAPLLGGVVSVDGAQPVSTDAVAGDEEMPPELQASERFEGRRRRRDRGNRSGQPGRQTQLGHAGHNGGHNNVPHNGNDQRPQGPRPHATPSSSATWQVRGAVLTPIPDLADLAAPLPARPEFLGAGRFGSRWGARVD
jgi:poly(A) polymerase